jgi:hypothetical protein
MEQGACASPATHCLSRPPSVDNQVMTTPRVEKPGISLSDAVAISLPADLLKRARNRLSVAAYIYAAGYTR